MIVTKSRWLHQFLITFIALLLFLIINVLEYCWLGKLIMSDFWNKHFGQVVDLYIIQY